MILQVVKEPVGRKAVKYLREQAAHWLPRITVRRGNRAERRFWQAGRGYDRNATDPKVILAMIEYLHANPVRRGLVSGPEDWKWSSARWSEGKNSLRPDPVDLGGVISYLDGKG